MHACALGQAAIDRGAEPAHETRRGGDLAAERSDEFGQLVERPALVDAVAIAALVHAETRAHPELALVPIGEERRVGSPWIRLDEEDLAVPAALLRRHHEHAVRL